jgi:vitamin B12 transporter
MSADDRRERRAAAAGALILIATLAAAEAPCAQGAATASDSLPTYRLDPVEIEAEAGRLLDEGAPVALSVVEGAALERPGMLALADALRALPGVRVARSGAPGSFAAVSIRGTTNEQLLVLVDGQRLTSAQGGGVDFGAVDVTNLERVEVLRGGASALYGPDALGGVINLVTRPMRGGAGRTTLRLEGGNLGTVAGSLRHDRPTGRSGRLWLQGHGFRTDGDFDYRERGRERERRNADAESEGVAVGLRLRPGSTLRLTVDGALESGEQGVPGTVEFPTPEARRRDRHAAASAMLILDDHPGAATRLAISARRQRDRRRYSDPAREIEDRHVNRSTGLELKVERSFLDARGGSRSQPPVTEPKEKLPARFTAGVEMREATLESTTDGDQERQSAGFFLRGQLARGSLLLAPALRLDTQSDLDPFLSPRLALRLDLPGGHQLRFATGRAYRPPSFDDLFFAGRAGALGNPDLAPERALEVELGVERGLESVGGRIVASLFWQEIEDLIQWQLGPDGRWRPHNVGLAVIRGAEFETAMNLHFPFSRASSLNASLSLLDARDRSGEPHLDGRRLPYRPSIQGQIQLEVPATPRLQLIAAWQLVDRSYITAANTKSVPGYGVVNFTAARRFGSHLTGSLAVLNLTDVAAVDVRDYPLPGREWRLALRLTDSERQ